VRDWRGERAGELRESKAKLTGRLGGAEWYWSNGSTASSKLRWQWRAAVVFWASGEGVAQCFGPERVEGNEGERLGSVERGVSGFGRGE